LAVTEKRRQVLQGLPPLAFRNMERHNLSEPETHDSEFGIFIATTILKFN